MDERIPGLGQSFFIGEGGDSLVFRSPQGKVYKFYEGRDIGPIRQYMDLINRAAAWVAANPRPGEIKIDDEMWQLQTEIVPVDEIVDGEDGPIGISEYIPGPRLEAFVGFAKPTAEDFVLLKDEEEKDFLARLCAKTTTGEYTRLSFIDYTKPLAAELNAALGAYGILVAAINVKVRADTRIRKIRFVVTDIADYIPMIKFDSEETHFGNLPNQMVTASGING